MTSLPTALSIAGSDSGAGAGIQADLLTFAANGVFGTTAITCLTAQNPSSVSAVHAAPGAIVREQAEQVARYFRVGAVKTGMLFNTEIIDAVAEFLGAHPEIPYVLDPVMISTSGAKLLDDSARHAIRTKLVPRATLVTPNLDEAELFLDRRPAGMPLTQKDDALELAKKLGVPVLLKGGHASAAYEILDAFATPSGECVLLESRRRHDIDTHGSGCTLAAAITASLAKGRPLVDAVREGHAYLQRGIHAGLQVAGKTFIAHLPTSNSPTPAPQSAPKTQDVPVATSKPTLRARPVPPVPPVHPTKPAPRKEPEPSASAPYKPDPRLTTQSQEADRERDAFFKRLAITLIVFCGIQAWFFQIPALIWLGTAVYFIYKYSRIGR